MALLRIQPRHIFYAALAIGFFLRLWGIWDLEFNYDELSQLFRVIKYPEWSEQVKQGILPDGHPPGVQALSWFWFRFISQEPFPFKFLCILLGSGSAWLVYACGRELFTEKTGSFAGILSCLLWFPLVQSLQIRPYVFGLFFVWLCFYALLRMRKSEDLKWLILYVIAFAACCYIHYFAALTVGLISLGALFFIENSKRKRLFNAWTAVIFLCLPAINVFHTQIATGGLDWLGAPSPIFFSDHLDHIFNHSEILVIGIALILLVAVALGKSWRMNKTHIFLSCIFILPILIGYFYSVLFKPVLQHSVLLFSMPALFILLGSTVEKVGERLANILNVLLIGFCIFSLIREKHFFTIGIKEPVSTLVKKMKADLQRDPTLHAVIDAPPEALSYHMMRQGVADARIHFVTNEKGEFQPDALPRPGVSGVDKLGVYLSSSSLVQILPFLEFNYGRMELRNFSPGAEITYFKAGPTALPASSTAGDQIFHFSKMGIMPTDLLEVIIPITHDSMYNAEVMSSIHNGDKQIDWRSTKLESFRKAKLSHVVHVIKLADIPGWDNNSLMHVHIEGGGNIPYLILKRRGNPWLYGIK